MDGDAAHVIDLKADHISCYGLKVEEGTKLWTYKDCANLPDDDAQADMYFYAVQTLEEFGYHQYEISNFAKDGFICRHNMKYWTGDEYLGFGPCAASDFAGKRFTIQADLQKYLDGVLNKGRRSSPSATRSHARARGRISDAAPAHGGRHRGRANIRNRSFCRSSRCRRCFQKLAKNDLCVQNGSRWRLTPKGFMLSIR